jgi:hypothetical protein
MWVYSTSAILMVGLPRLGRAVGPNRILKRFPRLRRIRRREPLPSPLPPSADTTSRRSRGRLEPPVLVDRRGACVAPWPEEAAAAVFA